MAENDKLWDQDGNKKKKLKEEDDDDDDYGVGFNTSSYIKLLNDKVIPDIKSASSNNNLNLDNLVYIRDNSKVHTGENQKGPDEKELLRSNGISLEDNWPSYSPDLNPVCLI